MAMGRKAARMLAAGLLCLNGAAVAGAVCAPDLRFAADEIGSFWHAAPGGYGGIDKEVMEEVAKRLHCRLSLESDSVVRLIKRLEEGSVDVAGHKFYSAERERVAWMLPYVQDRNVALVSSAINVRDAESFIAKPGLRLGVGRSFAYGSSRFGQLIKRLDAAGRVEFAADSQQMYRLLLAGRVQAIITTPPAYHLELPPGMVGSRYLVQDWVPDQEQAALYLMLSRQRFNETEKRRLEAVLAAMRKDGTMLRILEKYMGERDAPALMLR